MNASQNGLSNIGQIANHVQDVERATAFYRDTLGIPFLFSAGPGRGVGFEEEPHLIADMGSYEWWMTFFRDSEGNLLSLMGEIAKG
jgi:hypothetical protein